MSEQISNPAPAVFMFESHEVRVFERDGKPWFVAKDVADILGYSDAADAVKRHCKHFELLRTGDLPGLNLNNRGAFMIPQGDVFRLTVRSTLPTAEKFELLVMDEILPSIQNHGHYTIAPSNSLPTTSNPFHTLKLHYDVLVKHEDDINALTSRTDQVEDIALEAMSEIQDMKNSQPVLNHQRYSIQKAVGEKVQQLSEKHQIAYRPILFSSIYGFIKRYFRVPTYSAIPSIRFEEALTIIKNLVLEQLPENVIAMAKGGAA